MDWYSMSAADAVGKLGSSVDRGLSSREAEKRLGQDGENILRDETQARILLKSYGNAGLHKNGMFGHRRQSKD